MHAPSKKATEGLTAGDPKTETDGIFTAGATALHHGKQPRQISFTGTCQYVLASWMLHARGGISAPELLDHCLTALRHIATCEVGNRPGRLEPRVLKRRKHGYPLMQQPREALRAELRKQGT